MRTCILLEIRVGRLEKDLDSIEWCDNCLCLSQSYQSLIVRQVKQHVRGTYNTASDASCEPGPNHEMKTLFVCDICIDHSWLMEVRPINLGVLVVVF
jgi:hypothetical protein